MEDISFARLQDDFGRLSTLIQESDPKQRAYYISKLNALQRIEDEYLGLCERYSKCMNDQKDYSDVEITDGAVNDGYLNLRQALVEWIAFYEQEITIHFPGIGTYTSDIKRNGYLRNRSAVLKLYKMYGVSAGNRIRFHRLGENEYAIEMISGNRSPLYQIPDKKRKNFQFSFCNISTGDEIRYIGDDSVVAVVCDDKHVTYNGKRYTLSALLQEFKGKNWSEFVTRHFTYKGERLCDKGCEDILRRA